MPRRTHPTRPTDADDDPAKTPRKAARATTRKGSSGRSAADNTAKVQVKTVSLDKRSSDFGPPRWPGDTRPPLAPGNTLTLVYGHTSPRAIAQRAGQVHAELLKHAPYLAEPRFLPAVSRYLEAAARESLLHEHIMTVSAEKGPGAVPSRTWEQATAAARLAARLGSDLGLDPIGHARIHALSAGAEVSEASLQQLMEQGRRRIRASRQDAQGAVIDIRGTEGQDGEDDA